MTHKFARPTNKERKVWIRPASPPHTTSPTEDRNDSDGYFNQEPRKKVPKLLSQTNDSEDNSDSESSSTTQDTPKAIFKYKKVSQKVRPVAKQIPEHQQPQRQFPRDPLLNLPKLPHHPPQFTPTTKITTERMEKLAIAGHMELWPEERKLLQHVLCLNQRSIAFDEDERGTFRSDYFSDYIIPTVEHEPWIEKNIRVPQGYKEEVTRLLKEKIKAGVYERAHTTYRSKWFYVTKKDGSLRLVHDLRQLNSVSLRDSGVPPIIEDFVEAYAGKSVYTVLDMYWGFHARVLDAHSRDLTTFQTEIGPFRLTSLPMGYVNAPAEFQACMMFILQDEVPDVAGVFIDDIPIKGPTTKYLKSDGTEETLPENPGIRRYMWQHINDVHRVLHRIGEAGGTVSGKKMQLCQAEVEIVGHKCSAKGREPVESRAQKIETWPVPTNLKQVRGFLGLCGTVRIWIKGYSMIARPLVNLTRKGVDFHWGPEQQQAFESLKEIVSSAPPLRSIDYKSDKPIILSVDTSVDGIGMILSQEDENGRRAPARYGSIPLTGYSTKYGQSKLELYGLFRALHKYRAHIAGAKNLIVEVDASSIAGMLKNPDIQPSAVQNRWIKGVKQFDFKLVHVPADRHKGPDGLSRRQPNTDEEDSHESEADSWIDNIALASRIYDKPSFPTTNPLFPEHPPYPHLEDVTFMDNPAIPSYAAAPTRQYSDEDLSTILRYLVTKQVPEFKTARQRKSFLNKAKPFYLQGTRLYRKRPGHSPQVVIFPENRRQEILWEMHENIAHHGVWAVEQNISLRYFWPGMKDQIKEYVRSCHNCQLRSTKKMHIPVTISHPPSLFSKVYLDVMSMPLAHGKRWLVSCRDDLSGVTECKAIARDRAKVISRFFLKKVILRYGIVQEVVTDNGPSFGKEFSELLEKYGIHHIKISPYNSQANGVVERGHYNIREAIVKLCKGDLSKWPLFVNAANYADRITVRKATGYSPYYLLHGVHPLLPGDITDATFLVSKFKPGMTTSQLVQARARQLLRLPEDIAKARKILQRSRFRSKEAYEKKFARRLRKDSFDPGDLVLVRNNRIENSVSIERKTADRYMGPYRVIKQTKGGSYVLEEMDSSELAEHIAAYRLIPYVKRQDLDQWAKLVISDAEEESEEPQEPSDCDDQDSDGSET